MEDILTITNLNKSYNSYQALTDINLSIKPGEIHGLVGANGSGKTTLMNILFGHPIIRATGGYSGEIFFEGRRVALKNCAEAIRLGIGMVHQEFALVPDMSVGENIRLGREHTLAWTDRLLGREYSFIDRPQDYTAARQTLNRLWINLDVKLKIADLTTNMKQFVEIAREIDRTDLKLLILDEPTAVLNKRDGLKLTEILKEMAQRQIGILFISHRLEEIQHICDRVSVLRDGHLVAQYKKGSISIDNLARDMIGHDVNKAAAAKRVIGRKPVISFRNFSVRMPGEAIHSLDLDVHQGEILGLTSLSGHGKLAVGYGMMGMYPAGGEVSYQNRRMSRMDARANIKDGLYVLPDDRQRLGIIAEQSLEDNIIFTANQIKNMFAKKSACGWLGFIDHARSRDHVDKMIRDLDIKCTSVRQPLKELSGGNQQKVCIARALTVDPELLFVAEPTRGIDISAKEKILQMLIEINRSRNTTIVIASSELDELKRVCDRIAVMVEGRVFKILSPDSSEVEFGLALSGEEGIEHARL